MEFSPPVLRCFCSLPEFSANLRQRFGYPVKDLGLSHNSSNKILSYLILVNDEMIAWCILPENSHWHAGITFTSHKPATKAHNYSCQFRVCEMICVSTISPSSYQQSSVNIRQTAADKHYHQDKTSDPTFSYLMPWLVSLQPRQFFANRRLKLL